MARVYVGTAGFTYEHWRGIFYPQDLPQAKWLEFYAQHFQTVEINASFYHQMARKVYEGWTERTPQDFIFTVKGSRFITHIKRLNDCQEPVERFLDSVDGLGKKLGVILWQLPPRWGVDLERLKEFLTALRSSSAGPVGLHPHPMSSLALRALDGGPPRPPPAGTPHIKNEPTHTPYTTHSTLFRHAFEFRDSSWLNEQVYTLLKKDNAALVIQDSPYWPTEEVITADFTYLRFHGRESLYGSCYNKEELEEWAKKIKRWVKEGLDIYVFFNNDAQGYAVRNANELAQLISPEL